MNDGEWIVERDEDLTAPYAFQNKTWIAFEDKISVGIKVRTQKKICRKKSFLLKKYYNLIYILKKKKKLFQ